jgi:hypothetical protein
MSRQGIHPDDRESNNMNYGTLHSSINNSILRRATRDEAIESLSLSPEGDILTDQGELAYLGPYEARGVYDTLLAEGIELEWRGPRIDPDLVRGRPKYGDLLLSISGEDYRPATREEAIESLRAGPQGSIRSHDHEVACYLDPDCASQVHYLLSAEGEEVDWRG